MPAHLYRRFSLITLGVALFAAMAWACLHRGPWYDEFYTQFVARPDGPWLTALRGSWLVDNHPPLYYMLARASDWLGDVPAHRLLNVALGLVAVAGACVVVRDVPRLAPAGMALAFALAANPWTMLAGSELRSYFLSLCAGALLALALSAIRLTGHGGAPARRLVYGVTAMVAFNTHIVTSLSAAALIAPFLLAALIRRDWREARAIALPALAGGLVFTAVSLIQLPHWLANTQVFWIAPGFSSARWAVEWAVLHTLGANPLVSMGALAGAGLLARDVMLRKPSGEAGALALLACGLMVTAVGLIALHMMRPMLIEKYLTGMMGALSVLLALACGRALRAALQAGGPRLLALMLATTLVVTLWLMAQTMAQAITRPSWFDTGRVIAAQVARCPGTIVHTDPRWNDNIVMSLPRDNSLAVPFGYRSSARMLGFAVSQTHDLSLRCPTIFWGEHDEGRRFNARIVLAQVRQAGFAVTKLEFRRIGDGWLAIAAPVARP